MVIFTRIVAELVSSRVINKLGNYDALFIFTAFEVVE